MKKLLFALPLLLLFIAPDISAQSSNLKTIIDQRADELENQVIKWRRYFHENPELSNREFNTAKVVAEHLISLGLEVQTGIAHTGVVALWKAVNPVR